MRQVLITGIIILRPPLPFPSLSLPTDLVLAFDPDWRSTPRGCTVSARYHVNSHTKATLCHFRFSRLQNPGVSTLVCGRGRFLVVALPPPPLRHSPPVVHLLPLLTVTHQETECLRSQRRPITRFSSEIQGKRSFQQLLQPGNNDLVLLYVAKPVRGAGYTGAERVNGLGIPVQWIQ